MASKRNLRDDRSDAPAGGVTPESLILSHLDLIQHVVNQLALRYPRHVDRQELWNAGARGLVEAANRYRPELGVPFPRYAMVRIRGAIIDSTRDRDWAARALRRSARELRRAEERFEERHGRSARDEELAAELGIDVAELRELRASVERATLLHLDHTYEEEEGSLAEQVQETSIEAIPEEALERRELIGTLRTAVRHLPEVQRMVVERYYLGGEMLRDIAEDLGVTEARVSQICSEAINALRAYLGTLYEGVPEVPENAPGKRSRAAFFGLLATHSTWRDRLEAAEGEWLPATVRETSSAG
jgi:RNA polymerase sigma factor for flagellar operon FliA